MLTDWRRKKSYYVFVFGLEILDFLFILCMLSAAFIDLNVMSSVWEVINPLETKDTWCYKASVIIEC